MAIARDVVLAALTRNVRGAAPREAVADNSAFARGACRFQEASVSVRQTRGSTASGRP
ncbi:hypothetical protein XFF6990_140395 [Xanthomonas citri pv. fuscans]|nr:hypothetical protein XFF6990_140395 [Xanthomonas citri pv. fuscans]